MCLTTIYQTIFEQAENETFFQDKLVAWSLLPSPNCTQIDHTHCHA